MLADQRNPVVVRHWPDRAVVVADLVPELLTTPPSEGGFSRAWTIAGRGRHQELPVFPAAVLRGQVAVTFWTRDDHEVTTAPITDATRRRVARALAAVDVTHMGAER